MKPKTVRTGCYSGHVDAWSAIGLSAAADLIDRLPHGSGINRDWDCQEMATKPGYFVCSNVFEAMNETGMYCHNYPFSVVVSIPDASQDDKWVYHSFRTNARDNNRRCCGGFADYVDETVCAEIETERV